MVTLWAYMTPSRRRFGLYIGCGMTIDYGILLSAFCVTFAETLRISLVFVNVLTMDNKGLKNPVRKTII